jgi:hypothetical protein
MPRTVTVSVSVLLALALVVVGATVFAVGASQPDPEPPDVESVSVSPTAGPAATVVNATDLPRVQRAVFLLAVEPGESESFYTTDDTEQAAIQRLPDAVRYDGVVYDVNEGGGGTGDTLSLPLVELTGAAVAGIGLFGLAAVALRRSTGRGGD